MLGGFLNQPPPPSLRQNLSVKLELTISARLAMHCAPWPFPCPQDWACRHTMLSSSSKRELVPHAGTAGTYHLSCCPALSTIYYTLFLIVSVTSRKRPALTNYCVSAMNVLSILNSRYGYIVTPFCAQNSQGHSSSNGCSLTGVPAEWCTLYMEVTLLVVETTCHFTDSTRPLTATYRLL